MARFWAEMRARSQESSPHPAPALRSDTSTTQSGRARPTGRPVGAWLATCHSDPGGVTTRGRCARRALFFRSPRKLGPVAFGQQRPWPAAVLQAGPTVPHAQRPPRPPPPLSLSLGSGSVSRGDGVSAIQTVTPLRVWAPPPRRRAAAVCPAPERWSRCWRCPHRLSRCGSGLARPPLGFPIESPGVGGVCPLSKPAKARRRETVVPPRAREEKRPPLLLSSTSPPPLLHPARHVKPAPCAIFC